jgi:hypothetical protein
MRSIGKIVFWVCVWFWCGVSVSAQKTGIHSSTMNLGESITYEVYFKWGPLIPRAGDATFTYNHDSSVENAVARYELLFRTVKFFDNFFKMRDTLSSYYNKDNKLIYSSKRTNEGDYYSIDELRFQYGAENTRIHSLRYTPTRVKIDTTLTTMEEATDLLGAIYYLRGIDRAQLKSGDTFPLGIAIGRDLVNMLLVYKNQSIVERGKVKYNTLHFEIDIYDDAFESAKTSAELWMGDDDNFLPVKVRSKLKIGYVEVYYKKSANLKHPLKCRIEVRK